MNFDFSAPIMLFLAALLCIGAVGTTVIGYTIVRRWRKSRLAVYGWEVKTFDLPSDGRVQYAQWLHPKESAKTIQQHQVDAVREFVSPGDLVIDIGAHTGDTTVPLALAAGKDGCVLALEPNPYVFAVLKQNAGLNGDKTNIVPLPFAATDADGQFTFHYSDGGYCNGGFLSQLENQNHGHRQRLEVQGRNLENYLRANFASRLDRLTYIKIDTEGYDRQVILSLINLVRKHRPVIVCEVLNRLTREEREALHAVLADAGYDCFKLNDVCNTPTDLEGLRGSPIGRRDLCRWSHYDILALPSERAQRRAAA